MTSKVDGVNKVIEVIKVIKVIEPESIGNSSSLFHTRIKFFK